MFTDKQRQDLMEMSRIGYIDRLEIYVNTDDSGKIPHFHVRDAVEWDKFHTCIQIEKAEYFHHGNKQDVLNSRQKAALEKFMRAPVTIKRAAGKYENNWDYICVQWDANNSDVEIPIDAKQPDYTKL